MIFVPVWTGMTSQNWNLVFHLEPSMCQITTLIQTTQQDRPNPMGFWNSTDWRVRSYWASNFASVSASNSQTQPQSSSLNCISNPFHFNDKLSWKFIHKVNYYVSQLIWTDINKMGLIPNWVSNFASSSASYSQTQSEVPRSMWTDPNN